MNKFEKVPKETIDATELSGILRRFYAEVKTTKDEKDLTLKVMTLALVSGNNFGIFPRNHVFGITHMLYQRTTKADFPLFQVETAF